MQTEEELIRHLVKSDKNAQRELYERYSPKLWGVCLRYAKNQMSAEDIMQEGFLKILKYIKSYQGKGSFEGWMRRVMVNTAINYYKRNLKSDGVSEFNEAYGVSSPNADAVSRMTSDELLAFVKELPSGYKTVFNMHIVDGYTHKEIAKQLDISENTSKSQLSRARKILQEKIEKYYNQK
jgi:RNA polymerase sigma-70 factor (ECF subfamily)